MKKGFFRPFGTRHWVAIVIPALKRWAIVGARVLTLKTIATLKG
jgi:hypothetical protein